MDSKFDYDDRSGAVIRSVNNNPMVLDMDFSMAGFVITQNFSTFWISAELFKTLSKLLKQ